MLRTNQLPAWFPHRVKVFVRQITNRLNYGRIVRHSINGILYELDLSERIDSALYNGDYEDSTTRALEHLIRPDMVAFDIGANMGAHTLEIARHLSAGSVHAFEPTGFAFNKLQNNVRLNRFENIFLNHIALSDVIEEKQIVFSSTADTLPFNASWDIRKVRSSDGKFRSGSKLANKAEILKFETMDSYVARVRLDRLDFIKIDVDGYEMKVVAGGRETIERFRPILILELSRRSLLRVGARLEDLVSFFLDRGYSFHDIDTDAKQTREALLNHNMKRSKDFLLQP